MGKHWDPTKTRKYTNDENRRMAAYKAWCGGMSYSQVAVEFNYSDRQSARKAVLRARETFIEDAAEARDQATERIMGPLLAMHTLATEGDAQAATAYKGLEERLSKLLGLDAPVKTDVTSDGQGLVIQVNPDRLTPQAVKEIGGE